MTANAFAADRERYLAAGMNDHIPKPVNPGELYAVLLRWLRLSGVERVVCVKLCKKVVGYSVDPYALSVTRRA